MEEQTVDQKKLPEFHIGDRVTLLEDHPDGNEDLYAGATGTVLVVYDPDDVGMGDIPWVGVRWDDPIDGGHTLNGECEDEHGWNVSIDILRPDEDIDDDCIADDASVMEFLGI